VGHYYIPAIPAISADFSMQADRRRPRVITPTPTEPLTSPSEGGQGVFIGSAARQGEIVRTPSGAGQLQEF
jgi:hypothetical protein